MIESQAIKGIIGIGISFILKAFCYLDSKFIFIEMTETIEDKEMTQITEIIPVIIQKRAKETKDQVGTIKGAEEIGVKKTEGGIEVMKVAEEKGEVSLILL